MSKSSKQYALALHSLLEGKDKASRKKIMKNFVLKLEKDGALKKVNDILYILSDLYEKYEKSGTLYVANDINKTELMKIEKKMADILEVKKTNLNIEKQESLIGGFKAVFDEYTVDASILRALKDLKTTII